MVYFQTENPNLGKFWRALEWKMLIHIIYVHLEYFTAIWYILWPFGNAVVIYSTFWYFVTRKIWQPCVCIP
jgi:hypothetical protein